MISVEAALEHLFALVSPVEAESIAVREGLGRILREDVIALHDQPPFAASSMDGYAMRAADAVLGARLVVRGVAAAGDHFEGEIARGDCVRIFTGAPLPNGADWVELQEHIERVGDTVEIQKRSAASNIRPRGNDYRQGTGLKAPRKLAAADLALSASMGHGRIQVSRRPRIAIIEMGDELVAAGSPLGPNQIAATNGLAISALLDRAGAQTSLLPIVPDTLPALAAALDIAKEADLILTIGGASVGDHDLVAQLGAEAGFEKAFYKVAMRPGKPLLAGRIDGTPLIGLPGNPVSALVCSEIFVKPVLNAMLGLGPKMRRPHKAHLAEALQENGPRRHYMRGKYRDGRVSVHDRQDSALLSVLSGSNCLVIHPENASEMEAGSEIEIIFL